MRAMDCVNLFALAVNEENAAGHRIVTAPTNGAAGVVPAVLGYLVSHCPEAGASLGAAFGPCEVRAGSSRKRVRLASDRANGGEAHERRRRAVHDFPPPRRRSGLYQDERFDRGRRGRVPGRSGSASAMAAAGLAQALGGAPEQVENAAEIAMEHSLGLTW